MIRLTALAAFCFALAAYLLTLAPTISWRNGGIDSGELVTAIVTLGIPHPSGFPTFSLRAPSGQVIDGPPGTIGTLGHGTYLVVQDPIAKGTYVLISSPHMWSFRTTFTSCTPGSWSASSRAS